ncbi:carboxypeptidase regulatory-like domain-containing protein [Autumnicola musiva]|uniref:Carboxypeptidase regulatory-like domain-containing protein n=1 Tax=Autumnicola musiva TaxID=3075589 RepID=A0ABU3D9B7_9FLAO|nr:carboxypeptidase regulatory-like domain-containing protein [Zunongwangia sp. F117]MDT0678131.1 carboxypeptidase regulatory-like domain-containing protein [Zunongwangia sp. F117]
MKLAKYILGFILFGTLLSCSEDTIDSYGSGIITGTVVEEGGNEPVENVRISTNPASSTVFTDENGEFILEDIPEGDYSVEARKEGLLTQFEGVTVMPDNTVNVIFELLAETANNREPDIPQPLSPEDNATGLGVNVEFVWTSADPDGDDLTYELELRNSANEEIRTFSNINDTTYTVEGLNYGYKYFWQVKVSDSINTVLGPVYAFETSGLPAGRYLYVKQVNGNNVIFSSNEEGDEVQLTSSSLNSFRPRKNNATNKIAFLRTIGGQTHVMSMNPDGSNQFQITSTIPVRGYNLEKTGFSWANDGASLVYPNFENLYKVNATGGGTERIYKTQNGNFITDVEVSNDDNTIALLTNDANGYNSSIYTIDADGNRLQTVISGMDGALGGIDLAVDKQTLLFTRDVSGFENANNRQLDSRIFLYTFATGEIRNISEDKEDGTNDLDPRFSPNEAQVIFVNTSNDGVSQNSILTTDINPDDDDSNNRTVLVENAIMPDWE